MKSVRTLIVVLAMSLTQVGAVAQDAVLAQGNPPLTESTVSRLVDLYEFALGGRFGADERAELRRQIVARWADHDEKAVENYRKLLEVYGRLSALDDDGLRAAQAQFQAALVAELRKNPSGGYNPLLVAVYNRAHAGEEIGAGQGETGGPLSTRGVAGVPAALVGNWQAGSSSATSYTNSATGATEGGGGTQVLYRFLPGGRFEYASRYSLTNYNCTTTTLLFKTGRVLIDGATMTLVTEGGKFTSEDNCNRQYNYEKPAKLDRETYSWRVERDEYGTKLCLQNDSINGCAYKRD
jgi:hypothetical protein